MKYLKILSCKVLHREISHLLSACTNFIDVTYLRQGLHNTTEKLMYTLQQEIDLIDSGEDMHTTYPPYRQDFDAILIGYGLCSNSIEGLHSKKYPLIVPRAHDCITLFLGSQSLYDEYFHSFGGVAYWYNRSWIENAPMPGRDMFDAELAYYTAKYGAEKARDLVDLSAETYKDYKDAVFVKWDGLDSSAHEAYTRMCADYLGWRYSCVQGGSSLLEDFLSGNWDDERFQIVPPGKSVALTYDKRLLTYM
ncbi:MAG: DUF1638 domain-containing protein [Gracilibacteraceae bacterium]|jgi:hypothetical protein|nr:DUF1638 domain-containing protein [Gracilibacteraceae bacterium]